MNRQVQQLVQEVSHTLRREMTRKNSLSLITDTDKEEVRQQVLKLFENQGLPLDSERLQQITNELVAVKNAQIQSSIDGLNRPVAFKNGQILFHRKLDTSDFKKLSKKQQQERVCEFILNHANQSIEESETIIQTFSSRLGKPYWAFAAVCCGLSFFAVWLVLSFFVPVLVSPIFGFVVAAPIGAAFFLNSANNKKTEIKANILRNPSLNQKQANALALELLGIPKAVFSEQAYSLYIKHMIGHDTTDFNFLEPVDLERGKVIDFIEKTGIEHHVKSRQTLDRWRSTNHPIRHMELMALGVVATNLAA